MKRLGVPVAAAMIAAAGPAAAQVCREGALATVTCLPGPAIRPMPRQLQSDAQALERVLREESATGGAPGLTPAWRVNRFGDTLAPAGGRLGPSCRVDSLGNLRCP